MSLPDAGTVDGASLASTAEALCEALGYAGRPTFYVRGQSFERRESIHVVATAFDVIGVDAVFGLIDGAYADGFKPVIYVATASGKTEALRLHQDVWSQGVAPVLLLVTPDGVQIRQSFRPPADDHLSVAFDPARPSSLESLSSFSAEELRSSTFWNDLDVRRSTAIDTRLVQSVENLNLFIRQKHSALKNEPALVNSLIGRFMYLYVLIDRGIVHAEWMRREIGSDGAEGSGFAEAAVYHGARAADPSWSADEAWAVFDGVDRELNGSIFPIGEEIRERIPLDVLQLVHRVLRCGDVVGKRGHQATFLDVSFKVLRTETISAIYQRFLALEDGTAQKRDGVFYTPPFVADYVIARVDAEKRLERSSAVVDTAAGSGVFLVAAYRRILERSTPRGGWDLSDAEGVRDILVGTIFGVEKSHQAANVCRFSLYLTMLDYLGRATIEELAGSIRSGKLFPAMTENIVVCDAFEARDRLSVTFTHVVGNPPWVRSGRRGAKRNQFDLRTETEDESEETDAVEELLAEAVVPFATTEDHDRPVGHGRLSDRFFWLAEQHFAVSGSVIGLILPTTSLVGRQSGRFASAVASMVNVRHVANLSHLRYRLFVRARSSATVVVAVKEKPVPSDLVTIFRAQLPSLPISREGGVWSLLVSQTNLQKVRLGDLQSGDNGWFVPLMLGALDRRIRFALQTRSRMSEQTFGNLLERSGLRLKRGGDTIDTGVARRVLPGKKKAENLFKLEPAELEAVKPDYRPLFAGTALLVPRKFSEFQVLEDPHAFTSTFYGITFASRWKEMKQTFRLPGRRDWTFSSEAAQQLKALACYLNSDIVRYFGTLFGATFIMEGARMEKGDLESLPCPFMDLEELCATFAAGPEAVDEIILDRLRAGADLRRTIQEFKRFNRHYVDGNVPEDVFDHVERDWVGAFQDRLRREVGGSLTKDLAPKLHIDESQPSRIEIYLGLGHQPMGKLDRGIDRDCTFVGPSLISYDPHQQEALIVKTDARFAWTSSQAIADAEALAFIISSQINQAQA